MASKPTTVNQYLAALPQDRRDALQAVRQVILDNLDEGFEEGIQYGMIGYYVPHAVYPPGYHCDPKQPLPYVGLASQKNHMSLYLFCLYASGQEQETFRKAWEKTGRKLDMGKSCVRFKKAEDVPLKVVGDLIRRMTVKKHIALYEAAGGHAAKSKSTSKKTTLKKVTSKKTATKRVASKKTVTKKTATTKKAAARRTG